MVALFGFRAVGPKVDDIHVVHLNPGEAQGFNTMPDSYCLRCRRKTATTGARREVVKRKDGHPQAHLVGTCAVCGARKSVFVSGYSGGDIQQTLERLPGTPWAKFSGEKHLPGYSYCGPGTRLDKRLGPDGRPKPGLGPINRVDAACLRHDRVYAGSEDTRSRHKADVDLIHDLNAIQRPSLGERAGRAATKAGMKAKLLVGG